MSLDVARPRPPYPTLHRDRRDGVVAGVCSGLAAHLGMPLPTVRLAMTVLSLAGGMGLLFYGLLWMTTKPAAESVPPVAVAGPSAAGRGGSAVLVLVSLVGGLASLLLLTGFSGSAVLPLVIVGFGAVLVWRSYDRLGDGDLPDEDSDTPGSGRGRPRTAEWTLSRLTDRRSLLPLVAGGALIAGGVFATAANWQSPEAFWAAVLAVLVTLAGVAVLGVPLWIRLWDSLTAERAALAAEEERADIASRIHDSVLQTLALIQKRAGDRDEVARLARGQERELRQWLFGSDGRMSMGAATVFGALEVACGEVEDIFGIRVSPVTVGQDLPLDPDSRALVLAAREAMVNAAKHSGVRTADVYAENVAGELAVYVRDRGVGFDPDAVPSDRQGLRGSIRERMARHGGQVQVRTAPGAGTEVILTMRVGEETGAPGPGAADLSGG